VNDVHEQLLTLSLGAGVQSTVIALMVAEGRRGEVDGIDLSFTFLRDKRDDARRLARREPVSLGLPQVGGGGQP